MKKHISKVASVCYFHLRRLKTIRRVLGEKTTATLVMAFVSSRLDYCNAILAGLPKSSIVLLQRVQNATARLIRARGPRDHVTPSLHDLHWLPVEQRTVYKLCSLMHLINIGRSPHFLSDPVTLTSDFTSRSRLRSSSSRRYEIPATRLKTGQPCFSFAGPSAWSSRNLYKIFAVLKFLNAILKLYFSTTRSQINTDLSCAAGHVRCKRRNRKKRF